jgi:hypothetical protein
MKSVRITPKEYIIQPKLVYSFTYYIVDYEFNKYILVHVILFNVDKIVLDKITIKINEEAYIKSGLNDDYIIAFIAKDLDIEVLEIILTILTNL